MSESYHGGLAHEDERARLERGERVRKAIRAMVPALRTTEPIITADDPHGDLKRAARDARASVHAKRSESRDVDDELAELLGGGGDYQDDAARLVRVKVLRERQAVLPAEVEAAEDALALAVSRLQPVLDAERAAQMEGIQQAARKAERDLNERRKALSFEYHQLALRMAEIDRQLNDPTEQMAVMAQLRAAGLA